MFLRRSLCTLGLVAMATACSHAQPDAHLVALSAALRGTQEVPPVVTMGQGQLDAVLDHSRRQLRWKLSFAGLTGPATAAHFHGPALAGANAGVVLPIPVPATSLPSPAEGSASLTEAQVAEVRAGRWYVNVHTATHPGGEIRGQLTPQ
jgi:hypothetical protein